MRRAISPINPEKLDEALLPFRSRVLRGLPEARPAADDGASATPFEAAESAAPPALKLADVRISQLSLDMAQSLGYGDMLNAHAHEELDFYLVEFLASSDEIAVPGIPDVAIIKAVGVRIALTTTRVDGKVAGNLAAIAATATMSRVSQNVRAEVHGCPADMQQQFFQTFGKPEAFNMEAMKTFGVAVSELAASMVKTMGTAPETFDPKPLRIVEYLPPEASLEVTAISNGYALHRITQGDSYEDAMARVREEKIGQSNAYPYEKVDPISVLVVYDRIVGDRRKQPNRQHKDVAEAIQRLGH